MKVAQTIIVLAVAIVLSLCIYGVLASIEWMASFGRASKQLRRERAADQRQRKAIRERSNVA